MNVAHKHVFSHMHMYMYVHISIAVVHKSECMYMYLRAIVQLVNILYNTVEPLLTDTPQQQPPSI